MGGAHYYYNLLKLICYLKCPLLLMPRAVIPDGCAFWRLRDEDILNNIFSPAAKEVQFGTLYN